MRKELPERALAFYLQIEDLKRLRAVDERKQEVVGGLFFREKKDIKEKLHESKSHSGRQ